MIENIFYQQNLKNNVSLFLFISTQMFVTILKILFIALRRIPKMKSLKYIIKVSLHVNKRGKTGLLKVYSTQKLSF